MKLDIKLLDGQFYKARFSISPYKMKEVFDSYGLDYKSFNGFKTEKEKEDFYSYLQVSLIIDEINNNDLIPIRTIKYFYYNELKKAMPLIGIVFFIGLPDNIVIALPKNIPNSINDDIKKFEMELKESLNETNNVKSAVGKCLVDLGLYNIVESDVVLESSTVYYDLVKKMNNTDNDVVKINGLVFNMELEKGSPLFEALLNTKTGDIVILAEDDKILEVHVNKVIDKHLYTDNNFDKNKLDKCSFKSISELKKAFVNAEIYNYKVKTYFNYISRYIYEERVIEITDRSLDFYLDCYKENALINKIDINKLSSEDFKIMMTAEIIQTIFDNIIYSKSERFFIEHQIEFLSLKTNPAFFFIESDLTGRLKPDFFISLLILKYFERLKIINGIHLL